MNKPDKKVALQRIIDYQNFRIKETDWQCCLNCINWDKKKEECGLFNAEPPLAVIIVGCIEYEDDIPF